jgi:hypothetical protein
MMCKMWVQFLGVVMVWRTDGLGTLLNLSFSK